MKAVVLMATPCRRRALRSPGINHLLLDFGTDMTPHLARRDVVQDRREADLRASTAQKRRAPLTPLRGAQRSAEGSEGSTGLGRVSQTKRSTAGRRRVDQRGQHFPAECRWEWPSVEGGHKGQ